MDEKCSQLGIGIRKSNPIWFKQANLRKCGVKMIDNTSRLTRTTIQKDDDFSITGHVVFGSRMPIRKE